MEKSLDLGLKRDCNDAYNDGYLLTEQQYKAVELLIEGEFTKTEVAKKVGISRNTLHRWLRDDRFVAELREIAEENKRQTIDYINSKSLLAAKRYWALSESGDTRTKEAVLRNWLDRSVGKPKANIEIETEKATKSDYDINEALERLGYNKSESALPFEYKEVV